MSIHALQYMYILLYTHLFIILPDSPKVMHVQLRLHVLPAVVGYEWNLKRMVAHKVESLFNLGHGGGSLGVVGSPRSTSAWGSGLLREAQWLHKLYVCAQCVIYVQCTCTCTLNTQHTYTYVNTHAHTYT